ncbi:NAD(P)-dependent oxidoreductase [Mucilaginibacter myungsuensis]|uniref:NAD(P)-dependent oxidoreductase n=1 Tax=Mucilaginibacter myungsuensis TaxID=649104 RepID=A0A929KTK2_9SPHI|nr:NAD(P)-dependent oxidoreductase [Mucilaginibacter myungsuensis]MBE9660542.1 NAD(P)-dependent oxidoreductase [Mucilaginibacter myungsuensis]MDN3600587.1 NAD(P)-dependent oxidoreductase [Mucilaginibacter myungsuensis]
MKIALIGATGYTGTAVLNEALSRGHQVTAIARNPDKITVTNDNLTLKAVDIYDADALAEALTGHDAVSSSFNAGWGNPDLYADFIKGSETIQAATKKAGVKRLLVIGGAGSLYLPDGSQLVDSTEFPAEWKEGATAARDYLNILKNETKLDWTFLSPAINLHPGTRTGVFRLGTDNPVFNEQGKSDISVEDLAVALVDELEKGQFIKQRFTLGY